MEEVTSLIPRDVFVHSQQTNELRFNFFNLEERGRRQSSEKDTGLRRLARHFGVRGFISCRYFHVCGLRSFWETTQRKRSETLESGEHRPGWRPRKLIRRCIFDNRFAYLKNIPALSRCVNKLLRPSSSRRVSRGVAESDRGQMQAQNAWHAEGPSYVQRSSKN